MDPRAERASGRVFAVPSPGPRAHAPVPRSLLPVLPQRTGTHPDPALLTWEKGDPESPALQTRLVSPAFGDRRLWKPSWTCWGPAGSRGMGSAQNRARLFLPGSLIWRSWALVLLHPETEVTVPVRCHTAHEMSHRDHPSPPSWSWAVRAVLETSRGFGLGVTCSLGTFPLFFPCGFKHPENCKS